MSNKKAPFRELLNWGERWGWRKSQSPVEIGSTTGEDLLTCEQMTMPNASVTNRVTAAS